MVCQKYVINQNIVPNKLKKKSETYIPKSILFNNAFKKKQTLPWKYIHHYEKQNLET